MSACTYYSKIRQGTQRPPRYILQVGSLLCEELVDWCVLITRRSLGYTHPTRKPNSYISYECDPSSTFAILISILYLTFSVSAGSARCDSSLTALGVFPRPELTHVPRILTGYKSPAILQNVMLQATARVSALTRFFRRLDNPSLHTGCGHPTNIH